MTRRGSRNCWFFNSCWTKFEGLHPFAVLVIFFFFFIFFIGVLPYLHKMNMDIVRQQHELGINYLVHLCLLYLWGLTIKLCSSVSFMMFYWCPVGPERGKGPSKKYIKIKLFFFTFLKQQHF